MVPRKKEKGGTSDEHRKGDRSRRDRNRERPSSHEANSIGTGDFNIKEANIVWVTVAGRSNALSGVVASNTTYPTIACPPFVDKNDMLVNINSTLQCPSKVPVMTILEPCNVAIAINNIFQL